jgi:3',5'-cyclic-AMP phosphodiesterase
MTLLFTTSIIRVPSPTCRSRRRQTAAAGRQQLVVDDFSFAPATAAVSVGTTIMWTNGDDVPHNIISTEKKCASPVLDTDQTFSHTFDAPGTYKYYCSIHPRMTGQVEVA